jgi:hypothetical protein
MIEKEYWDRILSEIPSEHHAAVRTWVEEAIRDYKAGEQSMWVEQQRLWKRVAALAKSKAARELRQVIPKIDLSELPDPGFLGASAADWPWLARLADYLTKAPEVANGFADLWKPRERLYARLFRAWTTIGLRLSVSAKGPLVRFIQAVTDTVFPDTITGDAVSKAVQREQRRRRIFADADLMGRGAQMADAQVIKGGE